MDTKTEERAKKFLRGRLGDMGVAFSSNDSWEELRTKEIHEKLRRLGINVLGLKDIGALQEIYFRELRKEELREKFRRVGVSFSISDNWEELRKKDIESKLRMFGISYPEDADYLELKRLLEQARKEAGKQEEAKKAKIAGWKAEAARDQAKRQERQALAKKKALKEEFEENFEKTREIQKKLADMGINVTGVPIASYTGAPSASYEDIYQMVLKHNRDQAVKKLREEGVSKPSEPTFVPAERLAEIVTSDVESIEYEAEYFEGARAKRYTNYYERDSRLRVRTISVHGTRCMACGFDFEERYGRHGAGFIEVHHLRPVSKLKRKTKIDPKTDMAVVCSNCHRMIHRKRHRVLSLEELENIIS